MWPFSRPKEDAGLVDRLQTALRRLDDVESSVRLLKTEWLDTLDRFDRLAGRFAKRAERAAASNGAAAPTEEGPATPPPPQGSRALADVLKRRSVRRPPGVT